MDHPLLCHSLSKMGAIVQCVLIMHNMVVSDRVMGGDVHARYDQFASINCDNGYDINEQNVMKNQDGSVGNTVNNEQAQNNNVGLENTNPTSQENILDYQEHWKTYLRTCNLWDKSFEVDLKKGKNKFIDIISEIRN